jgi:class 3 adenylate cyclase
MDFGIGLPAAAEEVGSLSLKGFHRPIRAFNVSGLSG